MNARVGVEVVYQNGKPDRYEITKKETRKT